MARQKRTRLNYGALENRCLLANSVFFLNTATSTLHISAGVPTAGTTSNSQYLNEMTFTLDAQTNMLNVAEAGEPDQQFNAADIDRISYRGTFGNDMFDNQTDISARVVGFAGDDLIMSGNGDDVVIAANGNDTVHPGDGNDYVAGGQGDDHILEGDNTGNDRFFGGPGNDTLEGGAGTDFLAAHEGDDIVRGGADNDSIFGHDGLDQLFGGSARDFIYGGNGDDTISGGFGLDRILGQDGNDTISGGEHDDVILGGNGNDTIDGDEGNDRLIGNEGNDILRGGVGADTHISATPASNGNPQGTDTVETGDDTDSDSVLAHPIDIVTLGAGDSFADTEVIRRNLQVRFLNQNINNSGWQETDSGLQYRTVVTGTGDTPVSTDTVRVNYSGLFIDGVQFDANDNISFRLDQVIAGWTEGLQLMREGGTIELAIPAELAYGESGTFGIPPHSTLLFSVQLLEIV
jgi:Ca2+-binding RTX toxin-like protein